MSAEIPIAVRWIDTDALGHVNHAVYVTYVEEALTPWLWEALRDDWVVVRIEVDFRAEIRYADERVLARPSLERIGTSSVAVRCALARPDGATAAEARVVLVTWDKEARAARPVSDDERRLLEAL